MKQLEENLGQTFQGVDIGYEFFDNIPKAQEIKEKIDKRDYIKLKSFCTAKVTMN
jgi:hypothetical protein